MRSLSRFAIRLVAFIFIIIFAINAFIYLESAPYIYQPNDAIPTAEAVLIPGAAVYSNGTLSPILRDRVDTAVRLYQAKRVGKILVSGDNRTESHNEVNPVRIYLLGKGIPDQDIFLDHAGFDTYSSMYRARDVFGIKSLLIATQSFHLPRALFIARSLGIDARGVSAGMSAVGIENYIREAFADEKAVFDLITLRKPKQGI